MKPIDSLETTSQDHLVLGFCENEIAYLLSKINTLDECIKIEEKESGWSIDSRRTRLDCLIQQVKQDFDCDMTVSEYFVCKMNN